MPKLDLYPLLTCLERTTRFQADGKVPPWYWHYCMFPPKSSNRFVMTSRKIVGYNDGGISRYLHM